MRENDKTKEKDMYATRGILQDFKKQYCQINKKSDWLPILWSNWN